MTSLWQDRRDRAEAGARTLPTSVLESDQRYDVVVVGAGLTGLITALLLARAGRHVALLEAGKVGALTTGGSTAKVSLLQGTMYSRMLSETARRNAEAYVEANREGFSWLVRYLEEHGVAHERRDAFTYASSPEGASAVDDELLAAARLGLQVEKVRLDMPFPSFGAVRLPDQAQIDPIAASEAVAADFVARGGVLVEDCRVTGVSALGGARGGDARVRTATGSVDARRVVLATGTPILDRGLYFAKVEPFRSYAVSYRLPGDSVDIGPGMYISADSPTRSLRTVPIVDEDGFGDATGELLLMGGNGHIVGRERNPSEQVRDLDAWTKRYFPGAQSTHVWSAQDYVPGNPIPFVGWLPRSAGRVYFATGFAKWGMTNAVAAGFRIASELLGNEPWWAKVIGRRITRPRSLVRGGAYNLSVGGRAVKDWSEALLTRIPEEAPDEGEGVVGMQDGKPTAVSTVRGRTCAVSAVCPHLGGILGWNDQEKSWDCPLHGSRFAADGTRIEGPATADLATRALD